MSESFYPVVRIAKYTIADVIRQKSFIVMFVICALFILLVRSCYQGNFAINGQALDAYAVVLFMSKVSFHFIAVGVMVLAALLSMRVFRRDRDEGMQSCILSKPVSRSQYVAGKILGLWMLTFVFMFILHAIVFIITSLNLNVVHPGYLAASLLCSLNLLFVIVAVLVLSLLMPDVIAFLFAVGVGIVSFVSDGIFAISRSSMGQAMMQQSGSSSDLTGWKIFYYLWPKLSGTEQFAASIIRGGWFDGLASLYPLINILVYILILGALLLQRFGKEDIV